MQNILLLTKERGRRHSEVLSDLLQCEAQPDEAYCSIIETYCEANDLAYDSFVLDIEVESDGFELVCVYPNTLSTCLQDPFGSLPYKTKQRIIKQNT